tara:strand:+ start:7025 stop:7498 length:474 start_codon:yes stop_codon:yes gene_type:complete
MTIKQIVETIRQFHPQVSSTQIKILLNMGIEEFCRETGILHGYQQFTTDASAPIRYNSVLGIVTSGQGTHTVSNKLRDDNGVFDSSLVGHIVYNIKDETNAKITAVDSSTVLSIDDDIMAANEDYIIQSDMIEIDRVDFDGYSIPRLSNIPEKRDLT